MKAEKAKEKENKNKDKNEKDKNEMEESRTSTVMVYLVAVLYIVLGIAFLTLPQLTTEQFCYIISGGLILLGIVRIGEYFIRECYKNVNQYGFSVGVFSIILGICIIIRIQQFAAIFELCLGIGLLLTAIIKLQNAMDLKALGNRLFLLFFILAVAMAICAAVILVNPFPNEDVRNEFTYGILVVDGVLSILSTTYLVFATKKARKAEAALAKEASSARKEQEGEPQAISQASEESELKAISQAGEESELKAIGQADEESEPPHEP